MCLHQPVCLSVVQCVYLSVACQVCVYAYACLCVAHVCWCVVGTCRSFLPSGLCGGSLFGVMKVTLGFPVARVSCDPAPCPAEVNVRFLLHPLLNRELTR